MDKTQNQDEKAPSEAAALKAIDDAIAFKLPKASSNMFPGSSSLSFGAAYDKVRAALRLARDRVVSLVAERDVLQEKASFYDYLRDVAHPDSFASDLAVTIQKQGEWGKFYSAHVTGDQLDFLVRAAIAATAGTEPPVEPGVDAPTEAPGALSWSTGTLEQRLRQLLEVTEGTNDGDRDDSPLCVFLDIDPTRFMALINEAIGVVALQPTQTEPAGTDISPGTRGIAATADRDSPEAQP